MFIGISLALTQPRGAGVPALAVLWADGPAFRWADDSTYVLWTT